ncbi:MAG: DegT/DnrJ/EryC1/StrS family aminotransferase, partial [Planctomycetota bacterium]
DLRGEYNLFREEIRAAVEHVLESQQFIGGPAVAEFEDAIRARYGVGHAIAISNGTDALLCALMALSIGHGDEVIVPSFTFFATAGAVWRVGAKPVFVDIDPRTFNLDPERVSQAVTPKTRAIIPVHLFGQCADMDGINATAKGHGLKVIEDAAQAIGATYNGRFAGKLGDVACLSFYPTKNLGGFGEGGMILTDDGELATVARQLRNHGESQRYHHDRVGGNFRLDTMKAAILLVKLRHLDEFTRRRRHNAACYDELLGGHPEAPLPSRWRGQGEGVTIPYVADGQRPVYHQYSILCDRRDELIAFLRDRGVATGVYYPVPLHRQRCFASLGYGPGSLPITEQTCSRIVSIPCHPMLGEDDVRYVATCIHEFGRTEPRPLGSGRARTAPLRSRL